MTTIKSVQERRRGQYHFWTYYNNLCALQNTCPIPAIKAHLKKYVLNCHADRIRLLDWNPLIDTLKINKSLRGAAFRSFWRKKSENVEVGTLSAREKIPPIQTREIIVKLCRGLKGCLLVTECLNSLELRGIHLMLEDIETLSKGLANNRTLQHISLEYCQVKDEGVEALCIGLKNSLCISSVNVSGCLLTWKGAAALARVISHQAAIRHAETWKESLRYRWPNLDSMPGLRRITACINPQIGDKGACCLADVLKDDLWLKALDLQNCGITNEGAKKFESVLHINTNLTIIDLRMNEMINSPQLEAIMQQIAANTVRQDCSNLKWMKLLEIEDASQFSTISKQSNNCSIHNETGLNIEDNKRLKDASKLKKQHKITSSGAFDHCNLRHKVREIDTEVEDPQDTKLQKAQKILHKYRRQLRKEIAAREKAEMRLREVQRENKRLYNYIQDTSNTPLISQPVKEVALDNENLLSNIEDSLEKFHNFLDTLQNKGYGNIWSRFAANY